MIIREHVPLSSLTTFRVGGVARYVAECATEDEVSRAIEFAKSEGMPFIVLGEGSNILASDEGYEGVVLRVQIPGVTFLERDTEAVVTAGAGVHWDSLVTETVEKGLWGIETLAGIPGTTGASPVQNIGAYGTELKDAFVEARVLDTNTGSVSTFALDECGFGYRESVFKRTPSLLILSVTLRVTKSPSVRGEYKDLRIARENGEDLSTPGAVSSVVRRIREGKFPDLTQIGTAGSFFKNPTVSPETFASLKARYPELPGFPNEHGIKIPLAFVLDQVLSLRGYAEGNVALFERQPLVLVAHEGANARAIDAFASSIEEKVSDATSIRIEREVRMLP